ncbi:hypothetical protein KIW84_057181 [Lathyrus oleraceus]|uniref:Myb/SANT-like domain-containing protein n=1 Tax=Pisum sativum TaxID=3888 RepID=A0A9D4X3I8_PEA|nr:hypothetical protein KIW84_057181 [Pisum sativum]
MERLRTMYGIVYHMQNQSGFAWDDEKKMIKVDSDEVWKEYVKRNPRAMYYRNTPIPLFDKLARVYGKDRKDHASGKELANPSANVEMIDKQEEEQNDRACGKEPANSSGHVEMIDKPEEEQNDPACGKEPSNSSANVEMINKQEEEQNGPASGKVPASPSASIEMIDTQEEEQSDAASGKVPASPSASIEMIDKQEEQNGPTSGKRSANRRANVEVIDKQEEEQNGPACSKVPASPSASIEMIDKQEEEQTPRKHGCMEGPSKKRNGGENAIANSIFEFEKTIKGLHEKHIDQLGAVVYCLRVDRDIYDDSRKVMSELTKMGLTEQQYFTAADRILSVPHRLHIFWGCNDVNRLAFVKSLI